MVTCSKQKHATLISQLSFIFELVDGQFWRHNKSELWRTQLYIRIHQYIEVQEDMRLARNPLKREKYGSFGLKLSAPRAGKNCHTVKGCFLFRQYIRLDEKNSLYNKHVTHVNSSVQRCFSEFRHYSERDLPDGLRLGFSIQESLSSVLPYKGFAERR